MQGIPAIAVRRAVYSVIPPLPRRHLPRHSPRPRRLPGGRQLQRMEPMPASWEGRTWDIEMEISDRGIINRGRPGTRRAYSTFPALTPLADGSLLASYRVGSSKDSADGTVELRRSDDGGRSWGAPETPFATTLNGMNGSLRVGYITDLGNGSLLLAAMWVDRQTYPGQPLFDEETEGCIPTEMVLADSHDLGRTWSGWRPVPVPADVGPPSLTNPVLVLPSGRLALSIETNKTYRDRGPWLQRVVYLYSEDQGLTTRGPPGPPPRISVSPTRRPIRPSCPTAARSWPGSTASGRARSGPAWQRPRTPLSRRPPRSSCTARPAAALKALPAWGTPATCWRKWACGVSGCLFRRPCRTATSRWSITPATTPAWRCAGRVCPCKDCAFRTTLAPGAVCRRYAGQPARQRFTTRCRNRLTHPERSGPADRGAGRSPGAGTSSGRSAAGARGR